MARRAVAVLRPRERTRDEWAEAIRGEYDATREGFSSAVTHAIECGRMLNEVKSSGLIALGGWEEFVSVDCYISNSYARNLMRLERRLAQMSREDRSALIGLGLEAAITAVAGKGDAPRLAKGADAEPEWTPDQTTRRQQAETGQTVVLNMGADHALKRWSEENGRFVRCDRKSIWGNPFVMGEDGARDEVIDWYEEHYLPHKPSLRRKLPELAHGKVLGCWCYPEACHCEVLVLALDEMADEP